MANFNFTRHKTSTKYDLIHIGKQQQYLSKIITPIS